MCPAELASKQWSSQFDQEDLVQTVDGPASLVGALDEVNSILKRSAEQVQIRDNVFRKKNYAVLLRRVLISSMWSRQQRKQSTS